MNLLIEFPIFPLSYYLNSNLRKLLETNKSAESGGGTQERSPSEKGKIVVENWSYLPGQVCVYTIGEEAEIQEIFSKNNEKVNLP